MISQQPSDEAQQPSQATEAQQGTTTSQAPPTSSPAAATTAPASSAAAVPVSATTSAEVEQKLQQVAQLMYANQHRMMQLQQVYASAPTPDGQKQLQAAVQYQQQLQFAQQQLSQQYTHFQQQKGATTYNPDLMKEQQRYLQMIASQQHSARLQAEEKSAPVPLSKTALSQSLQQQPQPSGFQVEAWYNKVEEHASTETPPATSAAS